MIHLKLSDLKEAALQRPSDYLETILRHAISSDGEMVTLDPFMYERLCAHYRRIANASAPFDRVALISIPQRMDRRNALDAHLKEIGWSWPWPEWHPATEARRLPLPHGWTAGHGAWGCMESHRRVLERAILDDIQRLFVLEDDVCFTPDFIAQANAVIAALPADWDCVFFGGQFVSRGIHGMRSEPFAPGIVRAWGVERTHCYAVRGRFMRELYAKWSGSTGHCDHVFGPFQHGWNVFAADPFIAGQGGGVSDITGSEKRPEFWNAPPKSAPVYWFKSLELLNAVRSVTVHAGYERKDGIDKGLTKIARGVEKRGRKPTRRLSHDEQVRQLRDWISMIQWEGVSRTPQCAAAIYCPRLPEAVIRDAAGATLRIVETAEDLP